MLRKTFDIVVKEKRKDGGRILINTAGLDRDRDRVLPSGARVENYERNPVVQWGHNYRDPWATVGKTNALEISEDGIIADFELRPAANDQDPQNVVLLLWNGGWIRTASIGFDPTVDGAKAWEENEEGGRDFMDWELLEWSLVPIPANQDALRLAVKAMEQRDPGEDAEEPAAEGEDLAWIRRMVVESDLGEQTLFAAFHSYTVDVPEDAAKLDFDENGELVEMPDPNAGTTVAKKNVDFVPPIAYTDEMWGEDATYSISGPAQADEEMVKAWDGEWEVLELSEVLLSIPRSTAKAFGGRGGVRSMDVCRLKKSVVERVQRIMVARLGKSGDNGQDGAGDGDDDGDPGSGSDGGHYGLTPEEEARLVEAIQEWLDSIGEQLAEAEERNDG